MGACRTIDPARQAGRQQAPCRGARSDERDHVYFEHGMPVACDPERILQALHLLGLQSAELLAPAIVITCISSSALQPSLMSKDIAQVGPSYSGVGGAGGAEGPL